MEPAFNQLCRLCLMEDGGCIDILADEYLPLRIMSCASLQVKSSDPLPKSICFECRVQLERSFCFQQRCKLADRRLRKYLRLIKLGKQCSIFDDDADEEDDELAASEAYLKQIDEDNQLARNEELAQFEIQLRKRIRTEKHDEAHNKKLSPRDQNSKNAADCGGTNEMQTEEEDFEQEETVQTFLRDKMNEDDECEEYYTENISQEPYEEFFEVVEDNNSITENEDDEQSGYQYYLVQNSKEDDVEQFELTDPISGSNSEIIAHEASDETETSVATKVDSNIRDMSKHIVEENSQSSISVDNTSVLVQNDLDASSITSSDSKNLVTVNVVSNDTDDVSDSRMNLRSDQDIRIISVQNGKQVVGCLEDLKIFKCTLCPQSFTNPTLLLRHRSVHESRRGHSCEHCEKWFACKSSLSRHLRIHTGEKPYKCEICEKNFIQKEILKRHMVIHTGVRPFECPHCNRAFVQKQLLRQHINLKHTDVPVIEIHKCYICSKTFCHASGLSRHLLIHSGITYSCEVCSKKFTDKSAVKRHMHALHGDTKDGLD